MGFYNRFVYLDALKGRLIFYVLIIVIIMLVLSVVKILHYSRIMSMFLGEKQ